jgi:hypothetical protein
VVLTRVVKSDFEEAVCNSLIVWVVIVPNKTFRPLQKKERKRRRKRQEKEKKQGAESVVFFMLC